MKLAFWRKKPAINVADLSEAEMAIYILDRVKEYVYAKRRALVPPDFAARPFNPGGSVEFDNWGDVLVILHGKTQDFEDEIKACTTQGKANIWSELRKWQAANPLALWPLIPEAKHFPVQCYNASPAIARDIATDPPAATACACCE